MVQKVPHDSKQGLGNCFLLSDFFQHYTVRPTQPLEGVADQPVLQLGQNWAVIFADFDDLHKPN